MELQSKWAFKSKLQEYSLSAIHKMGLVTNIYKILFFV